LIKNKLPVGLVFILGISLISQACFGWIGFNPTDEGFVLEGSTRILNGQLPHADFVSIRPALSYYLHIPEVWLGGGYTLYLARWVAWLQLSAIAWWWTSLLTKDQNILPIHQFFLAGIVLCFSVHTFPLTAIHTIDGLFLVTLAVVLAEKERWLLAGFIAGLAGLCKQNYLLLLPILSMIYYRQFFKILVPGLIIICLYLLVFFLFTGKALFEQLSSQSGFLQSAILPFLTSPGFWAGILAGIACIKNQKIGRYAGVLVLLTAAAGLVSNHYIGQVCYGILGVSAVLVLIKFRRPSTLLAIVIAWLSAISVGYNSPAIMSGVLVLLVILFSKTKELHSFTIPFLWVVAWSAFTLARLLYPYRDSPFNECIYPVGEVLKTGKGLYTNERTYSTLRELDSLSKSVTYLVPIPDYCSYWVGGNKTSPLPALWPNKTETKSKIIINKLNEAVIATEHKYTWALQRYMTANLGSGLERQSDPSSYPINKIVLTNLKAMDSTAYFILYK